MKHILYEAHTATKPALSMHDVCSRFASSLL